jgi:Tol biopolymer transport system component
VRIGIRFFLFTLAALPLLAIVPAASSDVAQTQIVVQGGPGFQTETLDGTVTGSVAVAPGTNAGSYAAAANGSIAYGDNNGVGGVWVVNPNAPPVQVDSSPQDSDVAISPDGSKVAFTRSDPTTNASDIYVVNANGSGLTLVASGGANNDLGSPAFAPDGSTIAYTCTVANNAAGTGIGCGPTAAGTYFTDGVMLMNADGSDKRMIVGPLWGNLGDSLSWSPDGQSIAVGEISDQGPWEVYVYGTDGSDLLNFGTASHQVTQDSDSSYFPRFTPDGTQIVFEKVVDNQWTFFTIDSDGSHEQELSLSSLGGYQVVPPATGGGPSATVNVGQPVPSPDGTVVAASWIPECHGYLVETASSAFTSCIQGHGRTGFFSNTSISVASDDSIVYSDLSAGPAGADGPIWLSRPNAQPVELDPNVNDFEPTISADGSLVTFAREAPAVGNISGGSDIYTIHSDGSDLTLVASGTGTTGMYLSNPTLSPDGSAIAYLCGSIDHSYAENNKFCGPLFDGTFRAGGLMLMNADGSDKRMIVSAGVGDYLSWSPDGRWLATAGGGPAGGASQIFVYRTDGSDLFMGGATSRRVTDVTGDFAGAFEPQFSADGSQIMFASNLDDNGNLGYFTYVINRDRTDQHQVFLAPPDLGLSVPGLYVPPATAHDGPSASVAPTQVPVPDVRRIRFRVARARLAKWRLVAKIVRRRYSAISWGSVISQSPRQNTYARLGQDGAPTVVKLVISRGPRLRHRHR